MTAADVLLATGPGSELSSRRRPSIGLAFAVGWLTLVTLAAVLAPVLPLEPNRGDLRDRYTGLSFDHPFGTDGNGRDLFARVVFGSRVALLVGVVAVLIGVVFGALLGTVAGYARGAVDRVISTLFDAVLAFPALVLATALVASRGRSVTNVVVVIGLVSVPLFGRVARAATLSVAERDFVAAARTFGARGRQIVLGEILPLVAGPVAVYAVLATAIVIQVEGALSFLEVGVPRNTVSWGSLIAAGRSQLREHPEVSLFPTAVLCLTVFALAVMGERLRKRYGWVGTTGA
jgi:peptide/nickel transport system permease protein